MTGRRVAVVGGGLAGTSAALVLAERGVEVTLLEGRPRLGGATHSFRRGPLSVDNGQHVFLRCCTAYRGLLDRLGVADLVAVQPRMDIPVLRADGRTGRLRRRALPAPLHLAGALAGYPLLAPGDRVRAAVAARALGRLDPGSAAVDRQAFGDWLAVHGQRPAAVEALWNLLVTAALNVRADDASLALAATVVQTGLLSAADAGDIGWATVPLGRLHGLAAERELARRGVRVRPRCKATGLRSTAAGVELVAGGRQLQVDAVVLAVPHRAAMRLLPPVMRPEPAGWAGLGASPIVNMHVVYDRRVTELAFAAVVDSPVQWLFDRTGPSGVPSGQYLAVSLSAADRWLPVPAAELTTTMLAELARLLPAARAATVVDAFVTREPAATFRPSPGTAGLRPAARTSLPGVYLAGAWTDTGWPDTMEGAVRSGLAAARTALDDLAGAGRTRVAA